MRTDIYGYSQNQPQFTPPDEVSRWQNRLESLERHWQRLLDLFQEEKIEKAELAVRKERLDTEQEIIQERLRQFQGNPISSRPESKCSRRSGAYWAGPHAQ